MKEKVRELVRGSVLPQKLRPVLGLGLAVLIAVIVAQFFAGKPEGIFVPLGFVIVLFVLALRYGTVVAVTGSLLAALIFAHVLFSPVGNWQIESQAARQNIAWMILGSIVLSYLFVPRRKKKRGQ